MRPVGLVFLLISMQPMFSFSIQVIEEGWRLNSSVEAASIARTIFVDIAGKGDFTSIQRAVDSVRSKNNQWIRIHVRRGFYREKVLISEDKPFIFLEGEGTQVTIIQWGDSLESRLSPTFEVRADNFVAKSIAFKNTFNRAFSADEIKQAVAALVSGDKNSFHQCSFISLQDTLWDDRGRHLFSQCYIEGAIDFIFGAGQSIYRKCQLRVAANREIPRGGGALTAQGRESPNDPSGFVFQFCNVIGTGPVYLGRAWRAASRVVFYKTFIATDVIPAGWDAWHFAGNEKNIFYAEAGCTGKGSDMSRRVKWEKKLSDRDFNQLIGASFINSDGWVERQP